MSAQQITQLLSGLPRLLTLDEVAEILRVSRRTVVRYVGARRIIALQTSGERGRVLIPRTELERFIGGLAS